MTVKNYLLAAALGLTTIAASAQTQTFNFTGGIQTFTVPCGVDTVFIQTWGAQGGSGDPGGGPSNGGTGGLGGYAEGWLLVTPSEVLNIFVGGQGTTPTGGFNGGGNAGAQNAGGGGGASDVRQGGTAASNRVIVGGGGGGGGRGGCEENTGIGGAGGNGGSGGGGNGQNGFDSPQSIGVAGGGAGGLGNGTGGSAGIGCAGFLGQPGVSTASESGAAGGAGQSCCCAVANSIPGGGGGGGGQVGGGGGGGGSAGTTGCNGNSKGGGGGGGGGSSYIGGVLTGATNTGIWLGNGQVTISWNAPTPAATVITGMSMTMCAGGADTLSFSVPSDPNSNFYTWTVDAGLNFLSGQNSNMITVTSIAAGTFTISAVGVNSSCSLTGPADTITVTVNALPSVSLNANPAAICLGGSSTLSAADGSNSYVWNPGNQTGTSIPVSPVTSTTYTAVGTNAAGCVDSSTVTVTVNTPPTVTLGSFGIACLDDGSLTLTGGSPAGGVYSGTTVTGGTFSPSGAGTGTHTITYTYTDVNGCVGSDSSSITVDPCLGLPGHIPAGSIAISPNPAADVVTIMWNANTTVTSIKVMDVTGRVVMTETAINGNTKRLDVSALPAGTYTVSTEGSVKTVQTFVKQ